MKQLRKEASKLDLRLQPVLAFWHAPAEVLGSGEPLEYLVRMRLLFTLALASGQTWAKAFPVFRGTLLADCKIPLVKDAATLVKSIPAVSTTRKQEPDWDELLADPWSSTIRRDDWPQLLVKGLFPPDSIGQPAPQSHGADVLVRCKANPPGSAKPEGIMAAKQCKLVKTPVTKRTLQEEVDKCLPLLDACDKVCLVLVAFQLAAEVKGAFNAGDATKLVIRSNSDAAASLGLKVPENFELVVLGDEGLRSFLGDENVTALRTLIDTRGDANVRQFDPLQLTKWLRIRHAHATPLAPIPAAAQLGAAFSMRSFVLPPHSSRPAAATV